MRAMRGVVTEDSATERVSRDPWGEQGSLVLTGAMAPRVAELSRVCERILRAWHYRDPQTGAPGRTSIPLCMRHLNHPSYFRDAPDDFATLMDAVAAPVILDLARDILEEE